MSPASPPREIPVPGAAMSNLSKQVSNSLNLSTSPNLSFHSPPTSFRQQ